MQPSNSPAREIRRQQARAVIMALVNLAIIGLLSLFIPYATIAAGVIFVLLGGFLLLSIPAGPQRIGGWLYVLGGTLLALYGLYLAADYLNYL